MFVNGARSSWLTRRTNSSLSASSCVNAWFAAVKASRAAMLRAIQSRVHQVTAGPAKP
jgi:hypothetical protein